MTASSHICKRVLILIGGHLSLGPRAQKEAAAAAKAGFDVFIRGTWWDKDLAQEDLDLAKELKVNFAPLLDLSDNRVFEKVRRLTWRTEKYLSSCLGYTSVRSFGNAGPEMIREAKRLKPDLVMVHSESGLWAGRKLIEAKFRVGIDFEDWFSEDLPMSDRKNRPVAALKELEAYFLKYAKPQFATTECMADSLQKWAGALERPIAIPNSFPWDSRPNSDGKQSVGEPVKFYWFSQTIGPSRGLEDLASALKLISGNWELHLLGNLRSYKDWLLSNFGTFGDRIKLHPSVTNRELPQKTSSFDVGLALEIPFCKNKDLTASNKLFEYLRCGLPVIATDTNGQREVISRCPKVGWLVAPQDVEILRATIQQIIDHPTSLHGARLAALHAAEHIWAWELFEPRLIEGLIAGVKAEK